MSIIRVYTNPICTKIYTLLPDTLRQIHRSQKGTERHVYKTVTKPKKGMDPAHHAGRGSRLFERSSGSWRRHFARPSFHPQGCPFHPGVNAKCLFLHVGGYPAYDGSFRYPVCIGRTDRAFADRDDATCDPGNRWRHGRRIFTGTDPCHPFESDLFPACAVRRHQHGNALRKPSCIG